MNNVRVSPNGAGRGTVKFEALDPEGALLGVTVARPARSQVLGAWAAKHGLSLEQCLEAAGCDSSAPEPAPEPAPVPVAHSARTTGDALLDGLLEAAGVGIPEPGERVPVAAYRDLFGDFFSIEADELPEVSHRLGDAPITEAQRVTGGSPLECLIRALQTAPTRALIYWPHGQLAAVDVDWHQSTPPSEEVRRRLTHEAVPAAPVMWLTKRGCRLVFPSVRAASLAAVWMADHAHPDRVEVIDRTWAPAQWEVRHGAPDADAAVLAGVRAWLAPGAAEDVPEDRLIAWLAEHGVEMGGRGGAELCPSGHCRGPQGGRHVGIYEAGLRCYHEGCARLWTWAEVLGIVAPAALREAAQAFVGYDQVAPALEAAYGRILAPAVLREAWLACLAALHGADDPRLSSAALPTGVVRGPGGAWLDSVTLRVVNPQQHVHAHIVPQMSSVLFPTVNKHGEPIAKPAPIKLAQHKTNQTIPGMPVVRPLWGLPLWGVHRAYIGEGLRRVAYTGPRAPRYVPPAARKLERSRALVEALCPGVNWPYLQALLVGRAYAESGVGMPPMLLALGPSGAGKTATIALAAAMLGDTVTVLPQGAVGTRFTEHLACAAEQSGFILLDDYLKQANTPRGRLDLLQQLLPLGRSISSRQVFRGPVTTALESLIVVTDTAVPADVLSHAQLGRRLALVRLPSRVADWQATAGDVSNWRAAADRAAAADDIISDCVDQFLGPVAGEIPPWSEALRAVGLDLVEAHELAREEGQAPQLVRRLFELVLRGALAPFEASAPTWLAVDPRSEAGAIWRQLADGHEAGQQCLATAVDELDLGAVLGLPHPVELQRSERRGQLVLRFAGLPPGGRRPTAFNQALGMPSAPPPAPPSPPPPPSALPLAPPTPEGSEWDQLSDDLGRWLR